MILPFLSEVIPVYNEEGNIHQLYSELKNANLDLIQTKKISGYEIIFVNDGSTDNTQEILSKLKIQDKNLKILELRKNFGQTPALKAGFDNARGDLIVTLDGDLQNDPNDISKLIEKLKEGYDVVSGWRFDRKDKISKNISSKSINFLRKKLIGDELHDYGCALKIYKKECLKDLELFGELHRYITAYLYIKGYKIGEIKVNHRERKHGKTKYGNINRGIKGFFDLLFLKFWSIYSSRPLHFFGALALIQWIFAILIATWQIVKYKSSLQLGPFLMFSVLLVLSGLLTLIFGFLSEVLARIYFKDQSIYSVKELS
ncbi:MAG: glycosyltransferase family 2 protein [Nanoarchaeota archaeon]